MKNKPWYIWLSILAFSLLWGDTSVRILTSKNKGYGNSYSKTNLWINALGNMFGLAISCIMLPAFLVALSVDYLNNINSRFTDVINLAGLCVLYLMGVYATYRHTIWRKKMISHLLNSKSNSADEITKK